MHTSPYNRPYRPRYGIDVSLYFYLNLEASWGWWLMSHPSRFTPGKDEVPIVQEAGWAPPPVWMGAEFLLTPLPRGI